MTTKKIVLTGGTSGIGYGLLKMLLDRGHRVMTTARVPQSFEYAHANLRVIQCDVSKPDQIDLLFEQAIEAFGEIDIFIANAGFAYYERQDQADWAHVGHIFDTNVLSVIYSAQKMKAHKGDKPYQFMVTASGMSFISLPGYGLYSSTKAALRGFADAYRYELGDNQHLQMVYPIATRTSFFKRAGDSPVPWPSQTSDQVARAMLKGLSSKRLNIYPSLLFRITLILSNLFPWIKNVYCAIENKRFQNFEVKQ